MKPPKRNAKALRRLLPFMRPYRGTVIAASVVLVIAAAATLTLPVALRFLVDAGFSRDNAAQLDQYFLLLLAVALVLAVATAARYYLVSWVGERLVADLRDAVYRHVLKMSPAFFETTRTGEVLSRLTTDTTLIQSVIGSSVSIALRNTLLFVGGLIMLTLTSFKLTALLLLLIPAVVVPLIVFGRRVRTLSRDSQDRVADSSAVAQEVLNSVPTVQAYTQQEYEGGRFQRSVESAFETALRRIRTRAVLTALVIVLVFGAVVLVLWLGAHAVLAGTMTAGLLGQFLLYAVFTAGATGALSETWGEIQRAGGATERLMELLDTLPVIRAPDQPKPLPDVKAEQQRMSENAQALLAFEQVNFAYPSNLERPILADFNLTIQPGETVALVGPSGAGKSTLFQLLLRFYDPQSGCIRFAGEAITELDPDALRSQLAIVPQDAVIFADSAMENIRYGRPDATDAEVIQAAQHAAAGAFLKQLPDGYGTFLGERGVRLSGGQKQRIAIARAMLKDAPIILLDEATSALDAESERAVQHALADLTKGRTSLVIAHRLATVVEADRIVVIDHGKLVATGTHEQLLEQGGLYAKLAKLQFRDA